MLDIHRSAPDFILLGIQPSTGKRFVFDGLELGVQRYQGNLITNFFGSVPGTMLSDKDLIAVRFGKLRSGIKFKAQRGGVGP